MKRVALGLVLVLAACAPKAYDDPIPVMMNTQRDSEERLSAARQAEQRFAQDPRRIEALGRLLWDRGHPTELRQYAVDQLLALDEARFRRDLSSRLVLIQDPDTLQHIYDLAVARQWRDLTPAIVKRWAMRQWGMTDAERLEAAALARLHPGQPIERVVFDVFAADAQQLPSDQRGAAWELLNRLVARPRLVELLNQSPERSVMVADLKAAVNDLGVMPSNREELTRLFYLREEKRRGWWEAWRGEVARLNDEQKRGLELRHLPVLAQATAALRAQNRTGLLSSLEQRLADRDHVLISPTFDGANKEHPQRLSEWADRLSWADLLTIHTLLDALADPGVVIDLGMIRR